jgi:hypothetical protein
VTLSGALARNAGSTIGSRMLLPLSLSAARPICHSENAARPYRSEFMIRSIVGLKHYGIVEVEICLTIATSNIKFVKSVVATN